VIRGLLCVDRFSSFCIIALSISIHSLQQTSKHTTSSPPGKAHSPASSLDEAATRIDDSRPCQLHEQPHNNSTMSTAAQVRDDTAASGGGQRARGKLDELESRSKAACVPPTQRGPKNRR